MEKKHIKSLEKDPVNGKTTETNGADSSVIDRISHLPNEIICHILSFLPTKYAVGTCILSTRWKNLFPLIPNLSLQLDDTLFLHPESTSETSLISFTNFTSRLLNITLRDVPSIDALRLVCRRINDGQEIADWVRAALLLNVKKLTLLILQLNNSNLLFDSLFGCNIVSLNLFLDFADDDLELRFSLPNLNTLSVQFMKSNLVNAILASSPLLEYLVVHRCICSSGEKLRICSHSLKGLRLVNGVFGVEGEIEIDCAKLEYLNYGGLLASRYVAPKLKSIWVAHLNLEKDDIPYPFLPDGPAIELIKACCDAERLLFSQTLIRILHSCPHALPRLPKLAVLIINYMDSQGWELLPSFLQCAPNLKTLLLKEGFDKEHYEYFKASLKEPWSILFSQHNETGFFFEIARKVEN